MKKLSHTINYRIEKLLSKYVLINKTTINITNKYHFFDFVIIATLSSSQYIKNTTLDFTYKMKQKYNISSHIEGLLYAKWVIINMQNYTINFFLEEERIKYNLEQLWK